MLRLCFLVLISAVSLFADIRWTCRGRDGKFTITMCANCKKFYCWDGEIFSETKGYTPPPGYVLAYWAEVERKSAEIRADIAQKGKELREQVEQARQNGQRMSQERMREHEASLADLRRRMDERKSGRLYPATTSASMPRANPKTITVTAPEPAGEAPKLIPVSKAKTGEIQEGMDRAAVESILGPPHSAMSVPEEDGIVETLSYRLEGGGTFRVRIEKGKVASMKTVE